MAPRSSYNHLASNNQSPRSASPNPPHSSSRLHLFTVSNPSNVGSQDWQFSVLALAFLVNLFFWCSLTYSVVDIQDHQSHRTWFFIISLAVFIVPSILAAFLLLGPCPGIIRQWSHTFDTLRHSKNYLLGVNVFNAIICLIIVIVYLYANAIPQYENAQWENQFTYEQYLPIPSFVLQDYANISVQSSQPAYTCFIYNATSKSVYNCTEAIRWTTIQGSQTFLFNSSELPAANSSLNDLSSSITLYTYWSYNTQRAKNNYETSSTIYMVPAFFDPRMSLDTLLDCGLVSLPIVPASAEYSMSLTASYITDTYNLITRPGQSTACVTASKALFDNDEFPYISYSLSVVSSSINTDCQLLENGTITSCVFSAIINYGSQTVQTTTSTPGISKLSIVVNAGALVGGVQFLTWFLAMFAAP